MSSIFCTAIEAENKANGLRIQIVRQITAAVRKANADTDAFRNRGFIFMVIPHQALAAGYSATPQEDIPSQESLVHSVLIQCHSAMQMQSAIIRMIRSGYVASEDGKIRVGLTDETVSALRAFVSPNVLKEVV